MLARATILFICMIAGASLVGRAQQSEPTPLRAPFRQFPMTLDGWRGRQDAPIDDKVLAVLGVDDYLTRVYYAADRSAVGLYMGYYKSQRQGDTIHSPLNCLPGSGWEPLSNSRIRVPVDSGGSGASAAEIPVNRYIVQKGLDRQLVVYWYQSHGRVVASEYWGKFYLISDAIRLNRTDGALVRVIAPIDAGAEDGESRAERIATQFIKKLFPVLGSYLPV